MKYWVLPGALLVMTACSANPPATESKPSYAADSNRVQPSPIDLPAEIDPPPPVAPGSESPGFAPPNPPPDPEPKDDQSNRS